MTRSLVAMRLSLVVNVGVAKIPRQTFLPCFVAETCPPKVRLRYCTQWQCIGIFIGILK